MCAQVAHASMKDTSWGYYSTGSMDEWTKYASSRLDSLPPWAPFADHFFVLFGQLVSESGYE